VARLTKNNYNNCILPAHDGKITRITHGCQVSSRAMPSVEIKIKAHTIYSYIDRGNPRMRILDSKYSIIILWNHGKERKWATLGAHVELWKL